jgi:hypothetical protein
MQIPSSTQLHAYGQKIAGLVALVLGATQVAFAADGDPTPRWEHIAFAVFVFVASALHLSAGTALDELAAGRLGTAGPDAADLVDVDEPADVEDAATSSGSADVAQLEPTPEAVVPDPDPTATPLAVTAAATAGAPSPAAAAQVPTGTDGRPVADTPQA